MLLNSQLISDCNSEFQSRLTSIVEPSTKKEKNDILMLEEMPAKFDEFDE